MSRGIIGVTVGTPISPRALERKLNPVKTVNGMEPDENGNVSVVAGDVSDEQIAAEVKKYLEEHDIAQGVGVIAQETWYYLSDDPEYLEGGSWQQDVTHSPSRYTFMKIVTKFSDGTSVESEPVCIQGAKGDKGDTGEPGAQGEKGDTGADGKDGVSATHSWNGTVLTVTSASGTSSADLKGEKGDKGDTGAQGIQGIQGEKGEKGDTGAKGDKGDKGDPGDGASITVDAALDPNSTNPVQNKVITSYFNEAVQTLGQLQASIPREADINALIDAKLGVIENGSY